MTNFVAWNVRNSRIGDVLRKKLGQYVLEVYCVGKGHSGRKKGTGIPYGSVVMKGNVAIHADQHDNEAVAKRACLAAMKADQEKQMREKYQNVYGQTKTATVRAA